jgi:hypothetical protein
MDHVGVDARKELLGGFDALLDGCFSISLGSIPVNFGGIKGCPWREVVGLL